MFAAHCTRFKETVKVKTKLHLLFNLVFAELIATLINPAIVTGVPTNGVPAAIFWIVTFVSLATTLTFIRPIWNSLFWFYRIAVFCFCSEIMYLLANFCYKNYAGENATDAATRRDMLFWFAIWLIPPLMVYFYSKLRSAILGYLEKPHSRFADVIYSFFVTYSLHIFSSKSEIKRKLSAKTFVCVAVSTVLFFAGAVLYAAAVWTDRYFEDIGFAAVLFNIKYSPNTANRNILSEISGYLAVVIVVTLLFLVYVLRRIRYEHLRVLCFNRKLFRRVRLFSKYRLGVYVMGTAAFVYGAAVCIDAVGLYEYAKLKLQKGSLYEDYYVPPTSESITFPENKRNLIYIYLESMENTFASYEDGGNYDINYIPELTKLANENVNFSHTSGLGGQSVFLSETAYTMGSTVAQTSGVALSTPMDAERNDMEFYSSFLPGLTTLEDVLYENGYNQLFIRGEDTTFAGYSSYVGKYENSTIFDHNYAIENGYIPEDYRVHWGFEDLKLFDFVKGETLRLSEQTAPFCITLYTADTHGKEEGYKCEACENPYDNSYANAIDCSSNLTYNYITWLSEQSFFENTTIILYGDHLSELPADNGFIKDDDYVRTTYNCIINSAAEPVNEKNRTFCALDMFPTTLSAIGAKIEGDRLGLGTDLFSSTPTLCEELGAEKFVLEIQKRSDYYNKNFWLLS